MNNSNERLSMGIKIALLSAMAVILMYFDFPLIPAFAWLKLDFSEIPVLIGAFAFGPIAGIIIEGLKIVLYLFIKGSQTGFVGELANFLIGISFVVPAAFIYRRNNTNKSALLGMIIGTLCMEFMGIIANIYLLIPAYGISIDIKNYVIAGLIPFNGIKAVLISILTFMLYKHLPSQVLNKNSGIV